ncbi:SDR family NAD(P)-dependent oxidoreductase [Gandjariella thermophila]|uniref:Short-chain dehydrogenase n=1 Tax=Gandjariella thermophila TaxID=1931992 RepID=A0A4D4J850_9PSEU|nr:SDR family NAD(P)-dependent oxidoreductase [Gandjariella thermophila]GDY32975.1 short-chain dehydrogenase [Gandjariella thermophila]
MSSGSLPDLSGTVALVTGAGGMIGAGIARRFAAAGAAVAVHYRTSREPAERLVAEVRAAGGRATAVPADLRDAEQADGAVRATVAAFGRIDVLVNNAGVQPVRALPEMPPEQWQEVMTGNAAVTFLATRAAAARMIERGGGGSIVSIASIEGSQPAFGHAHYSAAKAAVLMHTRAAALEYGRYGIRVNAVSPGLVERDGIERDWPDGVARWRRAAPLTRLGTPEDVGNACVFLASPLASWITGQNLVVDGGVSAHPTW